MPGTPADVMICWAPASVHGQLLSQRNGGQMLTAGLERDVDIGLTDKSWPGGAFVYVPEEDAGGANARVRFQETLIGPHVTIATGREGAPGSLYFVYGPTGLIASRVDGLLGLESGLDMATGTGSLETWNPPEALVADGYDADTDPTLGWLEDLVGVESGGSEQPVARASVELLNPFRAGDRIRCALRAPGDVRVEDFDVAGRRARRLASGWRPAGAMLLAWDGLDDRGARVPAGVYHVRLTANMDESAATIVFIW